MSAAIGRDPWDPRAVEVIEVEIHRDGPGYRARVQRIAEDGTIRGQRELRDPDAGCQQLAEHLELTLSIFMGWVPKAPERPRPPPGSRPPPPPTGPLRKAPLNDWHLTAGFRGHLALGTAPGHVAGGLVLGVDLRWRALSLGLEGRFDPRVYHEVEGVSIGTALSTGALVVCFHQVWFSACARGSAGALHGSAADSPGGQEVTLSYGAVGVRAGAEWPIAITPRQAIVLRAVVDLDLPIKENTLDQMNEKTGVKTELWASPPINGTLGVGLGFNLF